LPVSHERFLVVHALFVLVPAFLCILLINAIHVFSFRGAELQKKLEDREFEPSSNDDEEPLQQVFSVSAHPTLPILVFSDGYMVTFAQLPGELNSFVFMRNLVLESSKHLKQARYFNFRGTDTGNGGGTQNGFVWLLLYAHRHQSILGAAGHIILTPANQWMEE
jgi:hypothetical protein